METYEEVLKKVKQFIADEGSDCRTALRFGAFSALALAYGKSTSEVYLDAHKLDPKT
jgi:hypothetical protein